MGTVIVYRVLPSAFLYAGMTVLEIVPELLNAGGKEKLGGRIRIYAVRMARNCKFLFMIGMLVPSVADVIGFRVDASYSFLIMAGILGTLAYYLYRIYIFFYHSLYPLPSVTDTICFFYCTIPSFFSSR